jgi:hypothetical protein
MKTIKFKDITLKQTPYLIIPDINTFLSAYPEYKKDYNKRVNENNN